MAIFKPGQRHRYHQILKRRGGRRNVTAALSLTAMVDMFTVLVIFLLQNYNTTGEILYIPKEVSLPKAQRVNDLKPAVVVTVSSKEVLIDRTPVATFAELKESVDWVIPNLRDQVKILLDKARAEQESKIKNRIQNVVNKASNEEAEDPNAWRRVTLQADKEMDYLSLKKVMYSIYEAGGGPINFAVAKDTESKSAPTDVQTQ